MSPQGEDQPPKRPKKPEYTVYGRSGKEGKKRPAPKSSKKKPAAGTGGAEEPREKPPYRVYKSRPSLRDRITKPSLSSMRGSGGKRGGIRGWFSRVSGGKRPWLRWILIFACGWLLLS